jgi:hypothetical protein
MRKAARLMVVFCAWTFASSASAREPVLVELFTAQGCASCGAADSLIGKLADRPNVIALSWSVDYWDYLGWKDTFAKPEFTVRQRAYDKRFGLQDVYTPQVIVGGAAQTSGDSGADIESLVGKALKQKAAGPKIRFLSSSRVAIGVGERPAGGADIWLIRYDVKPQDVEIKDGDNRGKTVTRYNVVREFLRLGAWRGLAVTLRAPPASGEGLSSVVIVQGARGGHIVALARLAPVKPAGG